MPENVKWNEGWIYFRKKLHSAFVEVHTTCSVPEFVMCCFHSLYTVTFSIHELEPRTLLFVPSTLTIFLCLSVVQLLPRRLNTAELECSTVALSKNCITGLKLVLLSGTLTLNATEFECSTVTLHASEHYWIWMQYYYSILQLNRTLTLKVLHFINMNWPWR